MRFEGSRIVGDGGRDTKKAAKTLKAHKKTILAAGIFLVLAAAAGIQSREAALEAAGKVTREAEGGSTQSRTFTFRTEDSEEQELTVEIAPQERSKEEVFELFDEAVEEWQDVYLGENKSAEEIRSDLNLPESVCDGLVQVSYESSDYDVLQTDGTVETAGLPEDGQLEELTVRFSYGDYERIETCSMRLLPPEAGSLEWIRLELAKELQKREQESRQKSDFLLPDSISGVKVYWEETQDKGWLLLILLGALAAFCVERKDKEAQKKKERMRRERLLYEYPQMVEQFSILLESGMTIRRVWERISARKEQSDAPSPCLAEMRLTLREIGEGCGEKEAYERFGGRIGLMPYRRFASILAQNLSKGTRNIRALLREEAAEALEMRKNRAKKAGEEASAKLLFPMLLMMMLILMVLLLPALENL